MKSLVAIVLVPSVVSAFSNYNKNLQKAKCKVTVK